MMASTAVLIASLLMAALPADASEPKPFAPRLVAGDHADRAKRGEFDAEAEIRCAQERGQELSGCIARIARGTDGSATVVVTFANGFSRRLTFTDGAFVRGNPTMSGSGRDVEWSLGDGAYRIRVDDQRYELPEGFVLAR